MKKLLLAALVVAGFASCKQEKGGNFEVSGTIENAPGKKVLLMEVPFNSPQPIILDSTELNNGSFTLKGKATEEGIYRLVIEKGPDVILVNDSKKIKVEMDVNNYRNYTVSGSPASESLHKLFDDYRLKDSAMMNTFIYLDSLQKTPGNDSIKKLAELRRDAELKSLNEMVKNFINKSNSPAVRFYTIGIASRSMSPAELTQLADAATAKFPEHTGLAKLKSMITVNNTPKEAPGYALLNQQAPELTMQDPGGKTISISQFKGKYVLVDFWASWCGPCRQENPNVVAAYNKFKDKNFEILGVSLDQNKKLWLEAIKKDNLTWPQMSDLKFWNSAAVEVYGFEGIPFNVLIDPAGKIIAQGLRGEDLENKLAELLK